VQIPKLIAHYDIARLVMPVLLLALVVYATILM